MSVPETDRVAFGLFEADLHTGELWRSGRRVKLPAQPFNVLGVLVSKAGEVVSRDELQLKVWGSNTNVDFERAVAGAINKIREALGDSAENPRFIQTLPKRGYRFIAPITTSHIEVPARTAPLPVVESPEVHGTGTHVADDHAIALPVRSQTQNVSTVSSTGVASRNVPRWVAICLGGALVALLVCFGLLWRMQPDTTPLKVDQLTSRGTISTGPPNPENLQSMATDGNRILTSAMENGRPRLSAISLSTGEVEPLALPEELSSSLLADISRDGSKLLLKSNQSSESEQPLWIVPASGGSALRVGNVLAHDATWMPDGKSILYANGNELSVIRLDDGRSIPFATMKGRAFWMRWSPDGKVLRMTLLDPATHDLGIWEMHKANDTPRRVFTPETDRVTSCCGTWTADGSAYVLSVGSNLWAMKEGERGAKPIQLTNGPLTFLSPVAARSGSRIFFMGLNKPLGMQQYSESVGFHPAPPFLANANRIVFSRDAKWVAWTDTSEKLWRARAADGSDKVQLTPDYLEVFMAHWSPDGKRLAVMAREPGKSWSIYLVNADGGTPEPVLHEDRNAADPDWSADGKTLVFGREPDLMGKESGSHSIQMLDLTTMRVETLPGSEGMFSPRWSPDGRWIVALSLNQKTLFVFDVQEHRWKELAKTSAADPAWSSDSKSVYVHAFLEEKQPIVKIGIPDGHIQNVVDLSAFRDRSTASYFFGGLTSKNEPMVEPSIGSGDLYTLDLKVK